MTHTKQQLRRLALARRRRQPDRERLSREIVDRLAARPEFAAARNVLLYVSCGSEVSTWDLMRLCWSADRSVAVPYCDQDELRLSWLRSVEELEPGRFGIREPGLELRGSAERRADIAAMDLVVVPGVAFDRQGARLGHGRGYYDRLLARVGPAARLIALAFECQVFECVPTEPHDVRLDVVLTERHEYLGGLRRPAD